MTSSLAYSVCESARGRRARLIAISGIDGSGKGYISPQLAEKLASNALRVALIAADGWLNLPEVRFGGDDPGEHFYSHAFRFEEMFSRLIEPLVRDGSIHVIAEYTEETANCYREHVYEFYDVDLILLEGIFLFKREYQHRYDLRLWIDCSFQTALERALSRSQEGLPPADTIAAYGSVVIGGGIPRAHRFLSSRGATIFQWLCALPAW